MKKILVLGLIMTMTLSMMACGKADDGGETENGFSLNAEPTEEELEDISRYEDILYVLEEYHESGEMRYYDEETETEYWDSIAFDYLYEDLQALENVDKWIGTEYASAEITREEVLESITVHENTFLFAYEINYDKLGNMERDGYLAEYEYDAEGKVTVIEGVSTNYWNGTIEDIPFYLGAWYNAYYFYNDDGTIKEIKYGDREDEVAHLVTPSYDEKGVMTGMYMLTGNGEANITYTYDDEKVVQIESRETFRNGKRIDTYTYTYDANGNVVREEHTAQFENLQGVYELCQTNDTEYKYDNNNCLISAERIMRKDIDDGDYCKEQKDVYEFTCDEDGNVVHLKVTHGGEYCKGNGRTEDPIYAISEIDYVYGNSYIYMPE